jgi:hypothetical protein
VGRLHSVFDPGQLVRIEEWIGMWNLQIVRGQLFGRDQRRLSTRRVYPQSEEVVRKLELQRVGHGLIPGPQRLQVGDPVAAVKDREERKAKSASWDIALKGAGLVPPSPSRKSIRLRVPICPR